MLDPLKEVNAATKRVALGVSTRETETMELNGGSFDDNAAQLKYEAERMGEIATLLNVKEKTEESKEAKQWSE